MFEQMHQIIFSLKIIPIMHSSTVIFGPVHQMGAVRPGWACGHEAVFACGRPVTAAGTMTALTHWRPSAYLGPMHRPDNSALTSRTARRVQGKAARHPCGIEGSRAARCRELYP